MHTVHPAYWQQPPTATAPGFGAPGPMGASATSSSGAPSLASLGTMTTGGNDDEQSSSLIKHYLLKYCHLFATASSEVIGQM